LDQHTLRLERDGVRLDVPRNYLLGWWPTAMTQSPPAFMAMANFPGFGGATRQTIRCFDRMAVFDMRQCEVVLFVLAHTASAATEPGRPYWFGYDPDRQPEPAEYGLMRNPKLADSYVWIGRNSHETLTVSCPQILHRCEMGMIASGFSWRIQFPKRLLPEWRMIADGLRALIQSFEAAPDAGAPRP
jgi:hypothetical protein